MADETNRNVNEQPQAQDMGELLRIRRDKLKALQDEGRDPFTITDRKSVGRERVC